MAGFTLLAAGTLMLGPFSHKDQGRSKAVTDTKAATQAPAAPPDRVETVDIPPQATFGELMTGAGVSGLSPPPPLPPRIAATMKTRASTNSPAIAFNAAGIGLRRRFGALGAGDLADAGALGATPESPAG